MPDLRSLLSPTLEPPSSCSPLSLISVRHGCEATRIEVLEEGSSCSWRIGQQVLAMKANEELKRGREGDEGKLARCTNPLPEHIRIRGEKKVASGFTKRDCSLDFITHAPKRVECRICGWWIHKDEGVSCSVSECPENYHRKCAEKKLKFSASKNFKCPKHVCCVCGRKSSLIFRCVRCTTASHVTCAPWKYLAIGIPITSRNKKVLTCGAVCWKHSPDWRLEIRRGVLTSNIKEAFSRLPVPYTYEEFNIDVMLKNNMKDQSKPSPYEHIKRNIYLFKKKRDDAGIGVGCRNCNADSKCRDECECRSLSISCTKACHCSNMCQNRPFRREKKIKVVKTEHCGWGVEAVESIQKGDFVIEYIGEVINDALCEQRLWDMKRRGDHNFYMCEIRKDFTIDATFKGNASRFLNHSCDPNCNLEKWEVAGETRVGVFASRSINPEEPLTYDYRFVQFGPTVKCFCGSLNCQGFLGSSKRKACEVTVNWGRKRKRARSMYASSIST